MVDQLAGQGWCPSATLPRQGVKVALARHGVPAPYVMEAVQAVGGITLGEIRQGQRRFDLVARFPDRFRRNRAEIGKVLIPTADGRRTPLDRLAGIRQFEAPATITREWRKRRVVVQCNVRGRDR